MKTKHLGIIIGLLSVSVPVLGQDNTNLGILGQGDERVRVRLIHAVPNAPAATISIGGTDLFSDVKYKQVTGFKVMPQQDDKKILIKFADGKQLASTEEFSMDDGDDRYTVLLTADEQGANPKVIVLEDDADAGEVDIGDTNEVEVSVINASPQNKSIDVSLDDNELVGGINFSEVDDEDAEIGSYTLKVVDSEGTNNIIASQPVSFTGAGSFTVLVLGQNDVRVVNDLSPDQDLASGAAGGMATRTTTGTGSMATTGTQSMMGQSTGTQSGSSMTSPSM